MHRLDQNEVNDKHLSLSSQAIFEEEEKSYFPLCSNCTRLNLKKMFFLFSKKSLQLWNKFDKLLLNNFLMAINEISVLLITNCKREHLIRKRMISFGHCPNYLPNSGNLVPFFGRQKRHFVHMKKKYQ